MRLRATQLSSNAHGPLRTVAALVAAMFAATTAPAFDWSASDLSTQYQDSGGTLPVTAVEQPAGLVLDRAKGGAKRAPTISNNGGFDIDTGWSKSATWTISGGKANKVAGGAGWVQQTMPLVAGRIYEVTFDFFNVVGTFNPIFRGGTPVAGPAVPLGTGMYRALMIATTGNVTADISGGTVDSAGQFDNFSVRELNGPNLWTGTPSVKDANWTDNGDGSFTSNGGTGFLGWPVSTKGIVAGRTYECIVRVTARTAGQLTLPYDGAGSNNTNAVTSAGTFRRIFTAATTALYIYGLNFAGTVDSIYIAEIPGNHLIQPTSASRPTLTARVNLITYSEQFDNAIWVKTASASVVANTDVAPDGTTTADTVTFADGTVNTYLNQGVGVSAVTGNSVTLSLYAKTSTQLARFGGATPAGTDTYAFDTLPNGWFRQKATRTFTTTASGTVQFIITGLIAGAGSYVIWGAQYSFGSEVIRYQRIASATDYDSVGFAKGWRFDGVDDGMYTAAPVNLSTTNKLTVTAAVQAFDTTGIRVLMELGGAYTGATGRFELSFNEVATAGYTFARRSATPNNTYKSENAFVVPRRSVVTAISNGDDAAGIQIRGDGVPSPRAISAPDTLSAYTNEVLYVANRSNSANRMNCVIHSIRGIGRLTSPDELGWLEAQAKLDMNNNL